MEIINFKFVRSHAMCVISVNVSVHQRDLHCNVPAHQPGLHPKMQCANVPMCFECQRTIISMDLACQFANILSELSYVPTGDLGANHFNNSQV